MIRKCLLVLISILVFSLFFGGEIYYLETYNNTLQYLITRIVRGESLSRDFIEYAGSEEFIQKVKSDLDNEIFNGIIKAIQDEGCRNIFIVESERPPMGGIIGEKRLKKILTSISLGELSMEVYPGVGDGIIFLPFGFDSNELTIEGIPERHIILYHELSHILNELHFPKKIEAIDKFMEAMGEIGRQNPDKAKKLKEVFKGLTNLDLVKFELDLGETDITFAELYTKYKLAKYEEEPVFDEEIRQEIYFVTAYLETVMPFELALQETDGDLEERFQKDYEGNLAKLKGIYADYVDIGNIMRYIENFREVIIEQGAFLMPDVLEEILGSLL